MLTGFILAAGFGTRLKPLTEHIPKALVPLCGKPILYRALEFCHQQRIIRIGVNFHHFPDQMQSFKEQSTIAFNAFHEAGKIRGTGGALYFAHDFLSESDYFFTYNVDIIAQVNIEALYEKFLSSNCEAGLVAIPVITGGSIYYDKRTKEYSGAKTEPDASGDRAEFIGMTFYKKDFLTILKPDDFSILSIWKRAQTSGRSVKIIETELKYWKDAGTPEALAQIHFDALARLCSFSIPPDMVVDFIKKKAYPNHYSPREISSLGPNVWCEAATIPQDVHIENSVVFSNAVLAPGKTFKKTVVTNWGEIPLGNAP